MGNIFKPNLTFVATSSQEHPFECQQKPATASKGLKVRLSCFRLNITLTYSISFPHDWIEGFWEEKAYKKLYLNYCFIFVWLEKGLNTFVCSIFSCVYTHIYMCICMYIHIHTHKHTHTYTHTNSCTHSLIRKINC